MNNNPVNHNDPTGHCGPFDYDPNDYRIRNGNQWHHLEGEHLEATYSASGVLDQGVNGGGTRNRTRLQAPTQI